VAENASCDISRLGHIPTPAIELSLCPILHCLLDRPGHLGPAARRSLPCGGDPGQMNAPNIIGLLELSLPVSPNVTLATFVRLDEFATYGHATLFSRFALKQLN
jgi:hypothetical protein